MSFGKADVLIAIQARSNSTRFPRKIYQDIGEKRVLDHVIDQAMSASMYVNRYSRTKKINCSVAVLHPDGDDDVIKTFRREGLIMIAGSENNVLSRYVKAQSLTDADFVVRLTSDCPLMLDYVIAKHIHVAVLNDHDYVSNIEPDCRCVADGFDCEVISRQAMRWLSENAKNDSDREHVTPAIRRHRPKHLSQAFVSMKIDTSSMKMSVDTPEDLDRIRAYYHDRQKKHEAAVRLGLKIYEL